MISIIGLTGPTGAGKGLAGTLFESAGIPVIDTDALYHALLLPPSPCLDELVREFGSSILCDDGTLNRRALADYVFNAPSDKKASRHEKLNRITHRYVLERTKAEIEDKRKNGCRHVIIDAPLLIESGFIDLCDKTVVVLADEKLRLSRIMDRDHLSKAEAMSRMRSQGTDDFYASRADYVLHNNGSAEDLKLQITELLKTWEVQDNGTS